MLFSSILSLSGEDWQAVLLSLRVSILAVVISLPFGVALGWLLARKSFLGKSIVETLVNMPLVLPPVVTGYVLLIWLGKKGWIGAFLHQVFGLEVALTWRAAVLAGGGVGVLPLVCRAR